jgi:purine-nucleoside phosphorylase
MGSTGHTPYAGRKSKNTDTETFGMSSVVNFRGKVPKDSGLSPVSANRITLKMTGTSKSNIIFQFSLTKDGRAMNIVGYKAGVPEIKAKVAVDAQRPSISALLNSNSATVRRNAIKLKDLMAKSGDMNETKLKPIANELERKRNIRNGGNR